MARTVLVFKPGTTSGRPARARGFESRHDRLGGGTPAASSLVPAADVGVVHLDVPAPFAPQSASRARQGGAKPRQHPPRAIRWLTSSSRGRSRLRRDADLEQGQGQYPLGERPPRAVKLGAGQQREGLTTLPAAIVVSPRLAQAPDSPAHAAQGQTTPCGERSRWSKR